MRAALGLVGILLAGGSARADLSIPGDRERVDSPRAADGERQPEPNGGATLTSLFSAGGLGEPIHLDLSKLQVHDGSAYGDPTLGLVAHDPRRPRPPPATKR